MSQTNATRILAAQGVRFEMREYDVSLDDLSAESVAKKVAMPPEQVFKTLLVRGETLGPCFAVLPGNYELDFKALAVVAGDRRMAMVPLSDVQPISGYIRGGVTAIGAKKQLPVFLDDTAMQYSVFSVSAGVRGMQVLLAPTDYIAMLQPIIGRISRPKLVAT